MLGVPLPWMKITSGGGGDVIEILPAAIVSSKMETEDNYVPRCLNTDIAFMIIITLGCLSHCLPISISYMITPNDHQSQLL